MKTLSVRQPWAWAIVHAGKDVENRDWPAMPRYRGPLLIHASKTPDDNWDASCAEIERVSGMRVPPRSNLQFGGVIGKVTLTDTASEYEGEAFDSEWWGGPCGLLLEDPEPIEFVPIKGKLGLFETPGETFA